MAVLTWQWSLATLLGVERRIFLQKAGAGLHFSVNDLRVTFPAAARLQASSSWACRGYPTTANTLWLLPPLGVIVITRVCLFVGPLVRDARCDFSKSITPIFMKVDTDVKERSQVK